MAPEELLPLVLVEVQSARESTLDSEPGRAVCEHLRRLSRSSLIVLLALGATFAGFVLASNAERLRGDDERPAERRGRPADRWLDWNEAYGEGEPILFTVDRLEVTESGWRVQVGIDNRLSGLGAGTGRDTGGIVRPPALRDG